MLDNVPAGILIIIIKDKYKSSRENNSTITPKCSTFLFFSPFRRACDEIITDVKLVKGIKSQPLEEICTTAQMIQHSFGKHLKITSSMRSSILRA